MRNRLFSVLPILFAGSLTAMPARAAPEEIQVYMDELGKAGEVGLDLHINHVFSGDPALDYPGAEPSLHRLRLTPEFSLGLGHRLELGLYLPLATLAGDGVARVQGAKVRLKWVAPQREGQHFFWGLNGELGRVSARLDQNPWNAQIKTIAGYAKGRWRIAANGNVDFMLSGPAPGPATFEFDSKIAYQLTPGLALGVENYNGLGPLSQLGRFRDNDQMSFLAVDTKAGKWDINAGLGIGYGGNRDSVMAKLVIGVPLPGSR